MSVTRYVDRQGRAWWKADFRVTFPDGSQKRVIRRKIPTREMALGLERKAKTEAFEGLWFDRRQGRSITVADLWKHYEPVTKRENRSWRSVVGRARHLCRHLGTRRVDRLTQRDVDGYRHKRSSEPTHQTHKPPVVSTVNREVATLKRMINYAVKCGDLDSNPLQQVKLLPENNVRQMVIDERTFARLLENAEAPLKPILVLAYDCGMRKREILDLKWSRVNLGEGTIRLAPEDTKTDKARVIHLTARAKDQLESLPRSMSGYVVVNPETGTAWNDIRKLFRRACKAAEIPHGMHTEGGMIFHDLRRSFVTNARKRGIPESVVMKMSGHRTRTVFDRYNVVDEEDLIAAVRRMEEGRALELEGSESGEKTGTEEDGE